MKRIVEHVAFELAVKFAQARRVSIATRAYSLGVQEGRRQGVRPLLPKATDAQIDKLLANSGGQN